MKAGLVVLMVLLVGTIGMAGWAFVDHQQADASARLKVQRYDLYCALRQQTLETAARDLADPAIQGSAAQWIATRMDARLASDDVMVCGPPFAMDAYRHCLARDDYACMANVVRAAEVAP